MKSHQMRAFRARHGYSQAKLATIIGHGPLGVRNIVRYENNHVEIPAPVARILAAMDRDPLVKLTFESLA